MNKTIANSGFLAVLFLAASLSVFPAVANATIPGITSTTIALTAKADTISTGDGDSMYMWGYASGSGRMQYPGPTVIVNQGAAVTFTLRNQLPVPVSIVFPGQTVTATGGTAGLLTREVPAAPVPGTTGPTVVTYKFTASQAGTYMYYSGTRPDLEVEMGMIGTIIVRPAGFAAMNPPQVYHDNTTAYNREYLFVLTEADPLIHTQVAFSNDNITLINQVDTSKRRPTDWFINGRNLPDTMADPNVSWLPTQPYNAMPMMHPGEKVLLRMVCAGEDFHPFHTHGQNHLVVAHDGRVLNSTDNNDGPADLAVSDYTTTSVPGETIDAIWGPWTGAKLGWDAYGTADINPHTCTPDATGFDPASHEWCADHYKPIPVSLPAESNVTFGVGGSGMWGGTPYLGVTADIPPLNPGAHNQQNPMGGYSFMWHSHAERELTTNDVFIGGMGTMSLVVPVGVPIP
jgi:plastocyanin